MEYKPIICITKHYLTKIHNFAFAVAAVNKLVSKTGKRRKKFKPPPGVCRIQGGGWEGDALHHP